MFFPCSIYVQLDCSQRAGLAGRLSCREIELSNIQIYNTKEVQEVLDRKQKEKFIKNSRMKDGCVWIECVRVPERLWSGGEEG